MPLSLIGTPKYPADFQHFDYVNPDAPKGGLVRMADIGSFDSLNPILYKGEAAAGLGLVYESLMADSLEEASTSYGLIAEWASYPPDFSSVTFKLRDEAHWHDGTPITPEDVVYSLEVNKAANPRMALYYKNVAKAEQTGPNQVTFTFDVKGNRELPMIMGQLTILPKHYWTGKDANGNQRDPLKTTLEPPLGSGPYRIKEVTPARTITYERVTDYWGKDLPVNRGQWNFDEIRFDYYRDETVAFESFKAGNLDYQQETSAKNWATAYDFAAVRDGWVKRQEVPIKSAQPMQCFVLNIRRPQFQDRRVRQAFNLAFDFEWANKNLFYGQYARVGSFFQGSELAAPAAPPQGRELEILNEVKDQVPPEVFTEVHKNPVNNSSDDMRNNLRKAVQLLKEAGYEVKNGVLINSKTGQQLTVEFLLVSPLFERIVQPYIGNLERLGIKASLRMVDSAQYTRRRRRLRLRHRGRQFRPVGVPRQRAARLLGLRGGRPRGQPQSDRHQGPGHRQAGRPRDLRQEPRGAGRRHQRARPRALVERFRGAAMVRADGAHRLLGPLRPARDLARPDPRLHASLVVRQVVGRQAPWSLQALTARPTLRALAFGAIAIGALFIAANACRAEAKHGLSSFGDLAYPADFQHFAYANPDAPKGGTFSLVGWGGVTTFDSLNNYILKGDAAQGLELLFDSLMVRAADEPDAVYGLVAKSAEIAPDGLSVTFTLRPEAKFNDGSPLTADDVVFSFETLKTKGHPLFAQTLADVVKAEALDPHTVRYSFKGTLTRDLPLTVAELPIFSKAYYASHDFAQTTLDPPLGSGPYVVGDLKQGRTISYKRNPNYWAKDLPVNRGRWNFDEIRFEYFRDRTAGMEAFKAGTYDFREEFTSKVWATEYDFPAIRAGKVKKEVLPDETPSGTQGYLPQHAARAAERPAGAQGARPRLRFRVDQPQSVLRALHPHAELLRELDHEGGRRAVAGGEELARKPRRPGVA